MHNNAFEHCVSRALVIYQPWWKQREECILYCLQLKDDDLSAFQAAKNWRSSHEGRGEEERRECLLFEEQVLLLSRDSASSKIQDCVGALSCTMYPLLPLWWQKNGPFDTFDNPKTLLNIWWWHWKSFLKNCALVLGKSLVKGLHYHFSCLLA